MKTNKYIIKFVLFIMSALYVSTMCSCRDDDDTLKESIIDEKVVGEILSSVVTEWGISLQQVTQRMNSYEFVTSQNDDFLMFTNRRNTCYISYKFQNDSLYSTLVLMSKMAENVNLGNILKGYSFLGEIGGANIYLNNGENVLICANEEEKDGTKYQAVGFTPISSGMSPFVPIEGITAGHEWVDLGLSVKWATCNVGAESPEVYGGYYAWGETEEKTIYDWSTYKWCNGSYDTQMKYCTSSVYGTVDNKTTLDPEDDVAHVQWGGNWRMPTKAEQDELCNNCTWSWTSVNGVNGYRVIGPNGNSIFLPAAGYRNGEDVYRRGAYGYYWSASLCSSLSCSAHFLCYDDGFYYLGGYYRYYGRTVRPVTE